MTTPGTPGGPTRHGRQRGTRTDHGRANRRTGPGEVLVVTGTGTGVGKTVVTAALAAAALAGGRSVAVVKPAQTGVLADQAGDVQEVARLAGDVTAYEHARYPEPLAPATAARRAGTAPVRIPDVARQVRRLAAHHDLVLVEGAGGLLVRFDDDGATLADLARTLEAPVLVVAAAGLGTLNTTALTAEALRSRGLACRGVVIGSMPDGPDLASRCNVEDLPLVAGAPLAGVVPAGAAVLEPATFRARSATWFTDGLVGREAPRPRAGKGAGTDRADPRRDQVRATR
ncbi:dethiobiotin synthase [Myceligenerans indicum]|uniref:ATP-dependent dethiobiotin synthetase BioD n=1 Tax=Myceligenerans indicum TaxID=2593663 RepID=A0ABS1LJD0_9MICO|nr:dethiobiotin synthase [Myceligenerans indicum]MBL0886346.1 ATP-dependent dethiobiotin synthetase BioD [Myceligenerans indicum]